MTRVIDEFREQRVIPVLRSVDAEDAVATAEACAEAGMRVIELTRSTPNVERALRKLGSAELTIGLGTVTHASQVEDAAAAGAQFIVSFACDEAVVAAAQRAGLAVIPGALTPTEVTRAVSAGADAVKLFPARLIAPGYIRDLRAVMPGIDLLVTGGLTAEPDELGPWLAAGAVAVGVGSALGSVQEDGAAVVTGRCKAALAAARIEVPT